MLFVATVLLVWRVVQQRVFGTVDGVGSLIVVAT